MSRSAALLFFISLIVFLFIFLHRKHSRFSYTSWIVTLWLLDSQSKDLAYYFQYQATMEAGSPYDRGFLVIIGILSLLIIKKRRIDFSEIYRENFILIILICYMFISSLWAYNPFSAIRNLIKQILVIIIAILVSSENKPKEFISNAFRYSLYIGLPVSLMLIKYYPEFGRQYGISSGELMWIGITGQKNDLAILCSFAIVFFIWSIGADIYQKTFQKNKTRIIIDSFILLLAIHLLLGPRKKFTTSSTSFMVLIIGIISLFILNHLAKRNRIRSSIVAMIIILIIIFGISIPFVENIQLKGIAEFLQRDETLTGRTRIWNILKLYAYKKLIIGYGYAGFWTPELRKTIASSAHNGYLDTILNIGIIGLFFLTIFYILFGIRSSVSARKPFDISILSISMIFMLLIHNFTESTITYISAFPSSLLVILSFVFNTKRDDSENDTNKDSS